MIKISELIHKFTIWESDTAKSEKTVLDGISLDIPSGQFTAILGPNGCGKSTLAKHLNVLLLPDNGVVWIDGKDTRDREKLWQIRETVGMVFQNPDNQIIGTSVEEDVAFGPENRNLPSEEIQTRVSASLNAVNLSGKRKVSPSRLSGGQKQRVAIAGVLADEARCIVLDEPTAMLDPNSRREVLELVRYLNNEKHITIVLITHHMDEVVDADQIILMEEGHIIKVGTPLEIFSDPAALKRAKMDAPQVVELSEFLYKKNPEIHYPALHPAELVEDVYASWERAGKPEIPAPHTDSDTVQRISDTADLQTPETPPEELLRVENISFSYGQNTVNACKVIEEADFSIHKGEFLALIGSSGSGKTTLIKHLNGLLKADSGDIIYHGTSIYDKNFRLSELRKHVGMVFQYPEHQLFGRTVLSDAAFGPLNMGMSKEEAECSAKESLALVGLDESLYHRSPQDLSGGQKRRAAIAGILAMQPEILILDEPAAGLDPETKHMVFDTIQRIREEKELAIILVSHHMEDVAAYAERVLVLHEGRLAMDASPETVFAQSSYLKSIGIGVPQVTTITEMLKEKGMPLPAPAVTVAQAASMLDYLTGKEGLHV